MRLQVVPVRSMAECVELCCDEPACDFVMLKKRKCHTVRCRVGDACTVEEGGDYQISFVSRQGKKMQNKKYNALCTVLLGRYALRKFQHCVENKLKIVFREFFFL